MSDTLLRTLKEIALGRTDGGRPLAAEVARQRARKALSDAGIGWAEVRNASPAGESLEAAE